MSKRRVVQTESAPKAIGTYSQAVRSGDLLFISGQIPLEPDTMELSAGTMENMIRRVFDNLVAIADAAGGTLDDTVKLTVYLTDLVHFPLVNEVMAEYFSEPYPARAAIGVASLPKGAPVEMEAILHLGE